LLGPCHRHFPDSLSSAHLAQTHGMLCSWKSLGMQCSLVALGSDVVLTCLCLGAWSVNTMPAPNLTSEWQSIAYTAATAGSSAVARWTRCPLESGTDGDSGTQMTKSGLKSIAGFKATCYQHSQPVRPSGQPTNMANTENRRDGCRLCHFKVQSSDGC